MDKVNVFVTGITGCVGHYLFDALSQNTNYRLFLLVRDPVRIRFDYSHNHLITLFQNDMQHIELQKDLLRDMDYVIHLATDWVSEMNDVHTFRLFQFLSEGRVRKVIYFSTASILDSNNRPMEAALQYGHAYIQRKYRLLQKLPELPIYDRITTIFPTMIFGGDERHPFSSASQGLPVALAWIRKLPFLSFDGSFHFIHAQDIARIVSYLLENDYDPKELVLGNRAVTFDECVAHLKKRAGLGRMAGSRWFRLKFPPAMVPLLARLFRIQLNPWDLFCLRKRHFKHQVVNAETFGLSSQYLTLEQIIVDGLQPEFQHELREKK